MKILVTGGTGFIGSAVVRMLIRETEHAVVNVDKLTYAAMPEALENAPESARYAFEKVDIADVEEMRRVFRAHAPDSVMHLAAESHVDRSIDGPGDFIRTNVVGTYTLLECAREYAETLLPDRRGRFRVHHVSTDEVFGSLGAEGRFDEDTPYRPNSPYSASKAAADHMARAWHHTYGLPIVVSNCSNNYGPWQFPEKLIPVAILNALDRRPVPVYGTGDNVRDWLHVEDHARALLAVFEKGTPGRTYNVGADAERANLRVVEAICDIVDRLKADGGPRRRDLIAFVEDRPGHDKRYAIDSRRIREELGWRPSRDFETGLADTVRWYLDHESWWRKIRDRVYDGGRLGRARK